ncbi:MAG TPA: hypothetical protein VIM70_18250 [Clostridium sp.]|uniref:hypothetical protein n=1 Tax=Clostridium sp. TaxID=1506 RepID=UPI002F95431E
MKIYVKLESGRSFKIPAPIGLVKVALGLGGFGVSIARRYIPKEQRQYIDCINFRELRCSMDVLRNYKGLKMVDVKAADGTEVVIVI